MHLSYFTCLLILVLCSSFSCSRSPYYSYEFEEDDHTSTTSISSTTTEFESYDELTEIYDDPHIVFKPIETTATVKKSTERHIHDNYSDDSENYARHEKVSATTYKITTVQSSPSSFSKSKPSTSAIIETTTSKGEILVTRSMTPVSRVFYYNNEKTLLTTTMDYSEVAAFIAKANRDRLYLKIFVFTVIICVSSLAVIFIIIHIARNGRRYHGYRTPANAPSNGQSKNVNDINV